MKTSVPGKKDGSESMVIEDSFAVPLIAEINGHPFPLRDAKATWMLVILEKPLCSSLSLPVQSCATVCVCVCVRVCACLFRSRSWGNRPTLSQKQSTCLFWKFIKASSLSACVVVGVCVCACDLESALTGRLVASERGACVRAHHTRVLARARRSCACEPVRA